MPKTSQTAAAMIPLAIASGLLFATSCLGPGAHQGSRTASGRASQLFARHCSVCHGLDGTGRNRLPPDTLSPPARDFARGLFTLVSTENGVPTHADIESVIRRGMPGSAMPSFAWLPQEDVKALARYVRSFAETAAGAALARRDPDAEGPRKKDPREAAPPGPEPFGFRAGKAVATPVLGEPTPELLARGRELYLSRCAACHGETGAGRRPVANWSGEMTIHWARDFTAGILKGGASDAALAQRIVAGMPGSGMPPTQLGEADLVALLHHVKSLIPPGSADRLVQKRQVVTARRTAGALPTSTTDPVWQTVPATALVLSPMQWGENAILHAEVRAVHDGTMMRVLLQWVDESHDVPALGNPGLCDRAALQFTDAEDPPFFGMGDAENPVTIWYWHPRALKDQLGFLDLVSRSPHQSLSDVSPVVKLPVKARAFVARGHASAAEFGTQDQTLRVMADWRSERWSVMLERSLTGPSGKGQVAFKPGTDLRMALAIWNGESPRSAQDKSFTIWHTFRIE